MKKLAYLLFGISLLSFLISILSVILYRPIEVKYIQASVEVTSNLAGFDLNASALTFGKVILGGNTVRNVLFDNNYPYPLQLKIEVEGDIADLIIFQDFYIVKSGESVSIPFSILSREDSLLGNYTGIVKIKMYKAR